MQYLYKSDKLPRIFEIIKTNLPDEMYLDFIRDGYLNINKKFPEWLFLEEKSVNTEHLWDWHKYRLHMEILEPYHNEINQSNKSTVLAVDGELFPDYCLEHYIGTLLCLIANKQDINQYIEKNLKQYEKAKTLSSIYKHINCGCQACASWCYEKDSEKNEQIYWIFQKKWESNTMVLDNVEKIVIKLCKPNTNEPHCEGCICDLCRIPEPIYEMKIDNDLVLNDLNHMIEDINTIKKLELGMGTNEYLLVGISYDYLKIRLENTTLFIEISSQP